jgi:hypothetical protein
VDANQRVLVRLDTNGERAARHPVSTSAEVMDGRTVLWPAVESWEALPGLDGRHLGTFKAPAYCQ